MKLSAGLGLRDLLHTRVPPDVGHDVVIPSAAHLPASVEAFKTLESNVQHDVTEREVRQQEPVRDNYFGHSQYPLLETSISLSCVSPSKYLNTVLLSHKVD